MDYFENKTLTDIPEDATPGEHRFRTNIDDGSVETMFTLVESYDSPDSLPQTGDKENPTSIL